MKTEEELIWESYSLATADRPTISDRLKQYYSFAEWVSIEYLDSIKEYDRNTQLGMSEFGSFDELANDIEKRGILEPVRILYSIPDNRVMLEEGNHRLVAATQRGWKYLPAIVTRTHYEFDEDNIKKSKPVEPYDREKYGNHVPSEFRPSRLGIPAQPLGL